MENFGVHKNVEYRCTTTNVLCNDTIIVLKITLLHSVSVMTNFVIPRHDKKHHTFSSTASAQPTIPAMMIEEVCAIFASLLFFDPISSFAARVY